MQRTYIALTHALNREAGREGNADIVLSLLVFFRQERNEPLLLQNISHASAWQDKKASRVDRKKLLKHFIESKKQTGTQTLWGLIGLSQVTGLCMSLQINSFHLNLKGLIPGPEEERRGISMSPCKN